MKPPKGLLSPEGKPTEGRRMAKPVFAEKSPRTSTVLFRWDFHQAKPSRLVTTMTVPNSGGG